MAHLVENTPKLENIDEKEGQHANNNVDGNEDPLIQFINKYKLQQLEEALLSAGLSIDILSSLTETQINDISLELTESAIQRVKLKYAIKQIQQKNNYITHKFINSNEEKIYVFTMATGINDKEKARHILEANDWNLQQSVAKHVSVNDNNDNNDNWIHIENVEYMNPIKNTTKKKCYICICGKSLKRMTALKAYGLSLIESTVSCDQCQCKIQPLGLLYHCSDKNMSYFKHQNGYDLCIQCANKQNGETEISIILQDNRRFKYRMKYNDTLWSLYSKLLQSVPDLSSKSNVNLKLPNGHILKENEFDQTFIETKLIPQAIITVNYSNHVNNNNHNKDKAKICLILPNQKKYTFHVKATDTLWMLYGKLLQSVPNLTSNVILLQLSNGHILKEYEFDKTMYDLKLVPNGNITVKYGNKQNNNNNNKKQHQYNKPYVANSVYQSMPSYPSTQNSSNCSMNNQLQSMMNQQQKQQQEWERERRERERREKQRANKERDTRRKEEERERKRKQEFIQTVRRNLPRISNRQNQCNRCGLAFGTNQSEVKARNQHQKLCNKSWNCGICGRRFDKYCFHQSHVRSCSNIKMMM